MHWAKDTDHRKALPVIEIQIAQKVPMLDLGIEVEEGLDALPQLVLDLFPASLQHVHGHVGLFAVFERHQGIAYFDRFLGRKQPHAVNQCQICHAAILLTVIDRCEFLNDWF
jgi:hypothetical protein